MAAKSYEREFGEINQGLKNLHEKMTTIDEKVTFTNGKIAKAITDIELLKSTEAACPAKKYFEGAPNRYEEKKFNWQTALTITNLGLMTLFFIANFVKPLLFP
jgi:hypothetical protein